MRQQKIYITFVSMYILIFLIWILIVPSHTSSKELGILFFFYFAAIISFLGLLKAIYISKRPTKTFWILILCTGISGFIMEITLFLKTLSIYEQEVFSYDVVPFFLLQYALLFVAFSYELIHKQPITTFLRFLFDSVFIIIITIYFMFNIILDIETIDNLSLNMRMMTFYFIVQSLFVYALISFCKSEPRYTASRKILIGAFLIALVYGYICLYQNVRGVYPSHELTYFVHTTSLLLIGLSSLLYKPKDTTLQVNSEKYDRFNYARLFLPYVSILATLFLTLSNNVKGKELFAGLAIPLTLLLFRQMLMWKENKKLLYTYQSLNEQLEVKVKEGIQALSKSEQQYKSLFEEHPDAVFSLDMDGNFQHANWACTNLFESYYNEFIGHSFLQFIVDEDRFEAQTALHIAKKGLPQTFEVRTYTKKGIYHHLHITLIPTTVEEKIIGMFGIARDITELKIKQQQVEHMAFHDALTGLPNRRKFEKELLEALQDARKRDTTVSVLFLDLDRFKKINDRLGHDVGDLLLIEVANRLQSCLRQKDVVARQGGDEFTIFLPDTFSKQEASLVANRLLQELNKPISIKEYEFTITPSIGIATYPFDGTNATELMKHADIAMYRAKAAGKNKFTFFSQEMSTIEHKEYFLENELMKALEHNEFYLQYQPQVNTKSKKIIGFEALVRWKHPKLGIVSPAEFIPIAEETGFIIRLGEWVLRTACKQAKEWHQNGFSHLKVGVNLSPAQFNHEDLISTISQVLKETQLPPEALDLEITESIAINKEQTVIEKLEQMQQLGVKISIDDFGTGYSSLSYLTKYPIHTLKIAREFIKEIENNPLEEAIMSSIITLAKNLQLTVIAEGVETTEQWSFLGDKQCDQIQGFLISKPIYAEEVWRLLQKETQVQKI
ncbi:DUF4084 domain-containing protein [Bacillus sp. S13(2024)]|uniref:DUF4084 domain-containing protein n=1 Tax=unclassified Bacillus (in: firmicutes) TaxID=185979 RepID=UPI003D1C7187